MSNRPSRVVSGAADGMQVRSSSPFDTIHDPSDPAWIGHAPDDAPAWWQRTGVRVAAAVIALLLGAAVAWLLSARDEPHARVAAPVEDAPAEQESLASMLVPQVTGTPDEAEKPPVPVVGAEPIVGSSGWAPAAATRTGAESGRLTGDLGGIAPVLTSRLDTLALQLGVRFQIISGWRSTHEQSDLYRRFLSGTGNLAAVPGTSRHEIGLAADVYVDGAALATVPGAVAKARALGLHFPVPGEAWHVEVVEAGSLR